MRARLLDHPGRTAFVVVLTAVLALGGALMRTPGTYLAQTNVLLYTSGDGVNPLDGSSDRLASLAGITAKSVNGNLSAPDIASERASLAAQGKLGWVVRQLNDGDQWTFWSITPMLNVQVTGHSHDEVRSGADAVISSIRADIDNRERAAGVSAPYRVQTMLIPSDVQFYYNNGDRRRAAAAMLLLAVLLATGAASLAQRHLRTSESGRRRWRGLART